MLKRCDNTRKAIPLLIDEPVDNLQGGGRVVGGMRIAIVRLLGRILEKIRVERIFRDKRQT
jgi:hypothetical protein